MTNAQASAIEEERRWVQDFAIKVRDKLRAIFKWTIPAEIAERGSEYLAIEYLPTSTDFYNAGIDYYGSPIGRKRDHYIFATTSGIILPEDYYGSKFFEEILPISELAAQSDKNPKREEYFKALANVQGRPRHYYFELNRASLAFKATIQRLKDYRGEHECEKYRQESIKTISRFLQTPISNFWGLINSLLTTTT